MSSGENQAYGLISTFALNVAGVNLLKEHHVLQSWVVLASNSLLKLLPSVSLVPLFFHLCWRHHKDAYSIINFSVNEALGH